MNKKNILFISTRDYDLTTDDATLEKKFNGLSRGMNVFVLARTKARAMECTTKYGVDFFLIPKVGTLFWMMRAIAKGRMIIKKEKIDIIVSQAPLFDGLVAIILKWLTRVEVIVEVHSDWIDSLFLQHKLPFKPFVKFIFKKWGSFVLLCADKVRVVSGSLKKQVEKNSKPKKIYQFPAYTELDIFLNEENISYEPVIAYAGWLYPLKGVDVLIRAFSRIKKDYPEYRLKIFGEGPLMKELKSMAKDVKDVEFLGWLELNEVKGHLQKISCLVLPSYSEGLPRILMEAAALKKPLVASEVGGIPEIVEDGVNGFLVHPGDEEELTLALSKIIGDKNLIKSMGEAGRQIIRDKYAPENFFEGYFEMIK